MNLHLGNNISLSTKQSLKHLLVKQYFFQLWSKMKHVFEETY